MPKEIPTCIDIKYNGHFMTQSDSHGMSNSPHLLDDMLNPTPPPQAQRITEEEIELGPIVGTGGFSDVHLGHWTDPGRTEQVYHPSCCCFPTNLHESHCFLEACGQVLSMRPQ